MRGLIVLFILSSFACVGCGSGFAPARQPDLAQQEAERRKAQEQFLAIVKTAKKVGIGYVVSNPHEVTQAWAKCFRKGDLAATYTAILATGQKQAVDHLTEYEWCLWLPYDPKSPDSSLLFLEVDVEGLTQLICHTPAMNAHSNVGPLT
jgi:hypothetical protein